MAVGGMAEIWRAEAILPNGTSSPVAIKRVLPELASKNPLYRSMFEDEARLGMLLSHPNIVHVFDAKEVAGTFLMLMELVDGTSLKSLVEEAQDRGAVMPLPATLYIARQLARALEYAHNARTHEGQPLGIIHRDVSPHNLLLGSNGDVKLADFGLADASVHEASTGELVGGKLGYLAPEVVQQLDSDARIDLFATGIILWELLAGRRLFQRKTDVETLRAVVRCEVPALTQFNPKLPSEVERLIARLLLRDREQRIGSAAELEAELGLLIEAYGSGVGASDVSLLVGLHLARSASDSREYEEPGLEIAAVLEEMSVFAQAASSDTDGETPLNPDDFQRSEYVEELPDYSGSGVHRRPD
ncbi:MAG: serine/threonine-protein kinase [Myxococcota bacterium]